MIYTIADANELDGISFNCGNEYIDEYFKNEALTDNDAVTYCFWADEHKHELVGIASLSCSGIIIKSSESFNISPAIEVKVFAVHERYQHVKFPDDDAGGKWSDYCWYYLMEVVDGITDVCGASHVVLYSVPDAVKFYERNGFRKFVTLMTQPSNHEIDGCVAMFINL